MAQARKHGREYAITNAVTEIIHIPAGFEHAGQTLINDGTNDIFWREDDATVTVTGTAAVLIATPIFASRLRKGESIHIASMDIVAVCSTDEQETTSTLRVAPGRLNQSGDVDLAAMAVDIAAIEVLITAGNVDLAALEVLSTAANVDLAAIEVLQTAIAASIGVGTSMTSVAVNLDAGAKQEVIATPGAGHALWIYGYELHANIGGTYQFLSAATAKTGIMPVAALGGVAIQSPNPIFKCATAEALNITAVTCAADGIITYRDVTL